MGELEEALIAASAAPVQEILRGGRSPAGVSMGRERGRGERKRGRSQTPASVRRPVERQSGGRHWPFSCLSYVSHAKGCARTIIKLIIKRHEQGDGR